MEQITRTKTHTIFGQNVKTLSDLVRDAHNNAVDKGFYEDAPPKDFANVAAKLALVHSEVSEALEELRRYHNLNETYADGAGKPEGFPVELADACIRIFDLCGWLGVDLEAAVVRKMEFNATRAHKHGKLA